MEELSPVPVSLSTILCMITGQGMFTICRSGFDLVLFFYCCNSVVMILFFYIWSLCFVSYFSYYLISCCFCLINQIILGEV